jgi:signal transduction histidine kinase
VSVALVAVVMLGLPLAYLSAKFVRDDARSQLQRSADLVLVALESELARAEGIDPARLLLSVERGQLIELQLASGEHIVINPEDRARDMLTALAIDDHGNRVTVSRPAGPVDDRMREAVGGVLGVSAFALLSAVALAAIGGRRLAQPLAELAEHSSRLGAGEVTSRAPRSGLSEVDAVAEVLDRSAARIGAMLQAEREFTANASHQLRTPLTALRLHLEPLLWDEVDAVRRAAIESALREADRLEQTIDALLELARTGRAGPASTFDLVAVVQQRTAQWKLALQRQHRSLVVQAENSRDVQVKAAPAAVGEALDVLVENSLRHGAGRVTVTVLVRGGYAVVVVEDQGSGIAPGAEGAIFERGRSRHGTGIGLSLARSLIEADGGRLELVRAAPAAFELYVPTAALEPVSRP